MSKEIKLDPYRVIPKDHCAAIGQVVVVWADFELTVDRAIWLLLRVDQQLGACVTAQLNSMFSRMNALASLAHESGASDPMCRKLTTLSGSLSSLSEERNRVVHDARFLQIRAKKITRFQATAKRKLDFEHKDETISLLHDMADRMNQKKVEFMGIWRELAAELEKLPPRLQRRPRKIVFPDLEQLMQTTDM